MEQQVQIGKTYETSLERGPVSGLCYVTVLRIIDVLPPTEQNKKNLSKNEYQSKLNMYKFSNGKQQIVVNIRELTGERRSFNNKTIPLSSIDTTLPTKQGGKEYINLQSGGGKRVIRYGARGGRYYMKGGKKYYI